MGFFSEDEKWMLEALRLAEYAESKDEVPVGAILVWNHQIIGEGYNCPIQSNDPTAHAEIQAIRNAGQFLKNYRLVQSTLYVTLEPCVMCAGAIIAARISRVVFGASDPKAGASGSVFDILGTDTLNHKVEVSSGLMEEKARRLLQNFFQNRREKTKNIFDNSSDI